MFISCYCINKGKTFSPGGVLSSSFEGGRRISAKYSRPGGRDLAMSKEVPRGLLGGGRGVRAWN